MSSGLLGVVLAQRPSGSALSAGSRCVRPLSRWAARTVGSLMVLLLAGCAGLEQAPPRLQDRIDSPATGPALIAPGREPSGPVVDDAANPLRPNLAGMAEPPPPRTGLAVPDTTRAAVPQAGAPMPKAPSSTAFPSLPPSAQPAAAAKRSASSSTRTGTRTGTRIGTSIGTRIGAPASTPTSTRPSPCQATVSV